MNRAIAVLIVVLAACVFAASAGAASGSLTREYVVLYKAGVSLDAAKSAVKSLGGNVVASRKELRIMLVRSKEAGFARAVRQNSKLVGAAKNEAIGFGAAA